MTETDVDWMEEIINGDFSSEKKELTTKKTPQEIEAGLFGGNADLNEIKSQVVDVRAMTTGKTSEKTKTGSSTVDDTKKYTTEELFLGLDEEEEPEEEVKAPENPEDKLMVYPESKDGVDTVSEMIMRNNFYNQSGGFYLVTTEYKRAKRSLQLIGDNIHPGKVKILEWDSLEGMPFIDEKDIELDEEITKNKLFATLNRILHFIDGYDGEEKYIFVIKDLSFFIKNSYEGRIIQAIEKINDKLSGTDHQLLITDMYERKIPENLEVMTKVKFDLPTEVDLNRMIVEIYPRLEEQQQKQLNKSNVKRIIDMLLGIEYEDARIKLLSIFHQHENIDKYFFMEISLYKKDMINRHKALEYIEAEDEFTWNNYIGRSKFKSIIEDLKIKIEHKEDYKNGRKSNSILLLGQPGTGKSYAAKCIGSYLGKPVVRVDLSGLLGKFQGDAKKNFDEMRKIFFAVKDHAVFWFDEFEKMFPTGDANISKSSTDSRLEGAMLTFFQDLKKSGTIMILTTNDPWRLSGAMTRPGRIDEKLYFKFPNKIEREQLIKFFLKKEGNLELDNEIIQKLIEETENFSESEIENFIYKVIDRFDNNRKRLLKNKRDFIYYISILDRIISLSKEIIKNHSMDEFFMDLKQMSSRQICEKYSIDYTIGIKNIFKMMIYTKESLQDKNSLIVQSDIKIPMIYDWLIENKDLAANHGNMSDIIRQMKSELNISGYLEEIIEELLNNIFDKDNNSEYDKISNLEDLKEKRYLLDNSENRKILLLLIIHNIDKDLDTLIREHVNNQLDIVFSELDTLSFDEFSQNIVSIFQGDKKYQESGVYDKLLEMIDIYTGKIIFPEISGELFLDKVKVLKKGITWESNKDSCEKIDDWGKKFAKSASKENTNNVAKGNIIIDYDYFEKRQEKKSLLKSKS